MKNKNILIKNIYYMLSYAFQSLNEERYKKIGTEKFENTADLFSKILIIGVGRQIKQGLVKEYIKHTETISSIRGKINIIESINSQSFVKNQLNCTYDEFSINCYLNQIIKSTMSLLLKSDVSHENKINLKKLLMYFNEVDLIDIKKINWKIRFDKNNQTYRMLIGICYLTINGLLQTENNGNTKLMDFLDNQSMHRLYEKFILNYYIKEHSEVKASSSQIKWQLDDDYSFMLPKMHTDVYLEYKNSILIIDAKYYSNITQNHFDSNTIRSSNLYQIFTYVKNKQEEVRGNSIKVSGMLLYARTNENQLDNDYLMSGNKISVKTLDLNHDFDMIKNQLDGIIKNYLIN